MTALLLSLALVQGGAGGAGTGPERILDRFLHAVMIRDSTTALSLLAGDAFRLVDSLAETDPARLAELAGGFGVQIDPATASDLDPRAILRDVLVSDALIGLFAIVEYETGTATVEGSRALIPVDYSFMGNEGTITVELIREDGRWRLSDYFGQTPLGG